MFPFIKSVKLGAVGIYLGIHFNSKIESAVMEASASVEPESTGLTEEN